MNSRTFASKRGRILHEARSERWVRRALAHLAREAGAEPVHYGGKLIGHKLPDGFVCEKRRYPDLETANEELRLVHVFAHLQPRKVPVRAYPCASCGGWHVTSRP